MTVCRRKGLTTLCGLASLLCMFCFVSVIHFMGISSIETSETIVLKDYGDRNQTLLIDANTNTNNTTSNKSIESNKRAETLKQAEVKPSPARPPPTPNMLFKDIQLFVSAFPGGFDELRNILIRSLEFFWPYSSSQEGGEENDGRSIFNIVIVLDDTVFAKVNTTETEMTRTIQNFFTRPDINLNVMYNPRSDSSVYGRGWLMQQLIMLWADNFTSPDAKYIGFIDDDTLFTKDVQSNDLFDFHNNTIKPRAIVRYPTPSDVRKLYMMSWYRASYFAYGKIPAMINAMSYFPVIVKAEHLPLIRQAMLDGHPEVTHFDDLYLTVLLKYQPFSQFMLMMDHLWRHHRDEYLWHFEPLSSDQRDDKRTNESTTSNSSSTMTYRTYIPNYIQRGTPKENGISHQMLQPFPRCAMHLNYMKEYKRFQQKYKRFQVPKGAKLYEFVSHTIRNGYCLSQPLSLYNASLNWNNVTGNDGDNDSHYRLLCQKKFTYDDIWNDINKAYEWSFEDVTYGDLWSQYTPNQTLLAHQHRTKLNTWRQWNQEELSQVFG